MAQRYTVSTKLALAFIAAVFAVQLGSAQDGPSFEVASIKPIAPGSFDLQHLAIKIDGQIAEFGSRSLGELIAYAYC